MKEEKKSYDSTHERLMAEGYTPEQVLQIRAKVSVSEKGKRYLLATNGKEESVVYAVDGNIVKEGLKCDKLVLVKRSAKGVKPEQWTEAFVELKGVDTDHAIDQLRQTLKKAIFKHPSNDDIRARIVAQSFPSNKSNPTMEKAKQEFRKDYNCDLRGMKSGQEDKL
ncbi:MAG: hypothetical protein MJZ19_05170 [Paludibacteraceae bacterium]|nr:hypothetical protein [Paludibacteraceae bacterium]